MTTLEKLIEETVRLTELIDINTMLTAADRNEVRAQADRVREALLDHETAERIRRESDA